MNTIPGQLRRWRGVTGEGRAARGEVSQAEAAKRLGVPLKTYQKWEQGDSAPRGLGLKALLARIGKPF